MPHVARLFFSNFPSLALIAIMTLGSGAVKAQIHSSQALRNASSLAPDLTYPEKVSEFSFFSNPQMALYKPIGDGPFPAIVLQHQCGGLRNSSGSWQNLSMLEWAKTSVRHGYVAMIIDSMGPRVVDSLCLGVKAGVNYMRGSRDALMAATHLKNFGFVDKERIVHAGFSWGGMVALAVSGKTWGESLGDGTRFAASVAFYPGCFGIRPASGYVYELLNRDVDRPLLVLMGELDAETPPAECVSKLEAIKANGGPVQWHIYPEATHCWDCKNLHNFSKTDFRGTRVTYKYSDEMTQDSENRMFTFFDSVLSLGK